MFTGFYTNIMPTRITAANVNIVKHLFSLQFPSSTCIADAQMMRRAVQRAKPAAAGIAQPRVLQQCSTCNVNQTAECVQLVAILAVCLMLQTSTNEWSIRCAATLTLVRQYSRLRFTQTVLLRASIYTRSNTISPSLVACVILNIFCSMKYWACASKS